MTRTDYAEQPVGEFGAKPTYHPRRSTILTKVTGRRVETTDETGRSRAMWDTVEQTGGHLSHEMPCTECGHAPHTFLPCSDTCDCTPRPMPGSVSGRTVDLVLS